MTYLSWKKAFACHTIVSSKTKTLFYFIMISNSSFKTQFPYIEAVREDFYRS